MNIGALWSEIEEEFKWRSDELRFFQNQLFNISIDDEKNRYRKMLILILYSHFEGFCKFALALYVRAINDEGLKCSQISYSLASASLHDIFLALRNPASKSEIFRNVEDDPKLHVYARDSEFLERVRGFEHRKATIPDNVVDMESNLKPIVLKKNLYKLGLPVNFLSTVEGQIHELLNSRNQIAHGNLVAGITDDEYQKKRDSTFVVMTKLKSLVMDALTSKAYLRANIEDYMVN